MLDGFSARDKNEGQACGMGMGWGGVGRGGGSFPTVGIQPPRGSKGTIRVESQGVDSTTMSLLFK